MIQNLRWHIAQAKVEFLEQSDLDRWISNPVLYFEFTPDQSDDGGLSVFTNPVSQSTLIPIEKPNGEFFYQSKPNGINLSAWVPISVDVVNSFNQSLFDIWSEEKGGWASCSVMFGDDITAVITSDQGGGWDIIGAEDTD